MVWKNAKKEFLLNLIRKKRDRIFTKSDTVTMRSLMEGPA